MSKHYELDFTAFAETVQNAPLRAPLPQDNGDSSHPLYRRMTCIDGADVGFPDLNEWVTTLAFASFLTRNGPLHVEVTEQQLERRVQLHVQALKLRAGLEPDWTTLDVPDEEGGVN